MHISLTPMLDKLIKEKVASGLYNNASEVVREALRFMLTNEALVDQLKLNSLKVALAEGAQDITSGRYTDLQPAEIGTYFQALKNTATDSREQDDA